MMNEAIIDLMKLIHHKLEESNNKFVQKFKEECNEQKEEFLESIEPLFFGFDNFEDIGKDNPYITMDEAMRHTNYSRNTITRAIEAGELKKHQLNSGTKLLFKKSDLDSWIKNKS